MTLLDRLHDGSTERGRFRFDDGTAVETAGLWKAAGDAASSVRTIAAPGESVAGVLTNDALSIVVLVGCWRAGVTFASLPLPGRSTSVAEYCLELDRCMRLVGARRLLLDAEYAPFVRDAIPGTLSLQAVLEQRTPSGAARNAGGGGFVQFTSGTTGAAKGVVLDQHAMGAQVTSLLAALQPRPGDVSCSWLPLSHDMGLFGMCMTAWAAGHPDGSNGGDAVVMRPETFLTDPRRWLEQCSQHRATITASPPFALDRIARRGSGFQGDLSALRCVIVGAEPVTRAALDRFTQFATPFGFRESALTPAYGLAEATLGVTMATIEEAPMVVAADARSLDDGNVRLVGATDPAALDVVSCGQPLPSTAVRITGTGVGEIEIQSPAACLGYAGGTTPMNEDGWLSTGDLGFLLDGELFPLMRRDGVLKVAGRSHAASAIELAIQRELAPEALAATIALTDDDGRLVVAVEYYDGDTDPGEIRGAKARVSTAVREAIGVVPRVMVLQRGTMPKTVSGKVQRFRVHQMLNCGELSSRSLG